MFDIKEELKKLPQTPGVYLMRDKNENIIYVGKSINLKNRVRQYFQESSHQNIKTKMLVAQIKSFEYIVTDTEVEALILENNLIKSHRPKYNVALKDDKTFPYIKITDEMYPRVIKVRQVRKDKALYFGPYNGFALNETLALIRNIWPLRTSKRVFPRDLNKGRPCLNYYIGRCKAPCMGLISEEDYDKMIKEIIDFLESNYSDLIKNLKEKMKQASEALNFEQAAAYRDRINSILNLKQKQIVENVKGADQDIIALAVENKDALIQIFFVRNGKITGRESIFLEGTEFLPPGEILSSFIKQFYSEISFIPGEIILEEDLSEKDIISKWLHQIKGKNVKLITPQRGAKRKLLNLAVTNAGLTLAQFGEDLKRKKARTIDAVQEVAAALGMEKISRIEAYDISNIFGSLSVGSMVVFEEGMPKSADYRKFKIKTIKGADDYGSIQEVISRRFKRLDKGGDQSFTAIPHIIFVDGGKGQVNAVKEVLADLNLDIPAAGMVKDELHRSRGLIFNNNEINFPKTSEAHKLISRIQEEVHRFAVDYHKKLRKQSVTASLLDEIEGIGPKRRAELFKTFGSIDKIKKATQEELAKVESMNMTAASNVYEYFR